MATVVVYTKSFAGGSLRALINITVGFFHSYFMKLWIWVNLLFFIVFSLCKYLRKVQMACDMLLYVVVHLVLHWAHVLLSLTSWLDAIFTATALFVQPFQRRLQLT